MAKTKNRLMLKGLDALSLVDNPANQHASAVIAKRMKPAPKIADRLAALAKRFLDKVAPVPPEQLAADLAAIAKDAETYEEALQQPEIWEKNSALMTAIQSIMDDAALSTDQKRSKIDAALTAYRDDLLSVVKDYAATAKCADCSAVMKDGACPNGHGVKKSDESTDSISDTGAQTMKRTAQTFTDVAKANEHIGVLTGQLNDADDKLDAEVAKNDPVAAITKGMTDPQAKAYRAQADRIAKLETESINKRFSDRAVSIFKGVMSDDDAGRNAALAVVKCLEGVASDDERKLAGEFLTKLAKQHTEVVKELDGMEVGGAGDRPASDDAERQERLEKAARELMKSEKGLTLPQAIAKALEADETLYDGGAADDEPAES